MQASVSSTLIVAALACVQLTAQPQTQARPGQRVPGIPPSAPVTGPRDRPDSEEDATGTARISGRVVGGEAGRPLRRAAVRLWGESLKEGRSTTTDEQGRYELKDLPAGRFHVSASKGGYVTMAHGQTRPFQSGRPIELADGHRMENVNFNLPRGSVIAGRITDEFGEAVAHVGVQALRYSYAEGRRQLTPVGVDGTDDRGRYRIFGLPPGEYYVSASADQMRGMGFAQSDTRVGFASTYFPGTPSAAEAERVRVSIGEESTSVSFAILPTRTARVTGTVLDSRGSPAAGGFIAVQPNPRSSGSWMMFGGGMIRPDGSFTVSNLSPGDYILHANSGIGRRDPDGESAAVPVTIGSEDITGLTIVTVPPTLITGQLVFETSPGDSVRPGEFMLHARAVDAVSMMGGDMVEVEDDWTFEMRLREGPALIRAGRVPESWILKAVMHRGVDVTDSGLPLAGERVDGVELVLSSRVAALNGTVKDDRERSVTDCTIIVFADDPDRWGPSSRYLFATRPTQNGRYEIAKLPAGHYLAVALDYLEEGQHTDPEYLAQMRAHATPFELADGERRTVNLKLVKGT